MLLCKGLKFENVEYLHRQHTFQIESLELYSVSSTDEAAVGRFIPAKTRIRIFPYESDESIPLMLQDSALGGLDHQVQLLNNIFTAYDRQRPEDSYLFDPAGLLLYGPSGVGKSLLLKAIAKIGWGEAFNIEGASCRRSLSDGVARIRGTFSQAKNLHRGIILVDQLDVLAPNTPDGFSELAVVLGLELEAANKGPNRILVVATATKLSDVDQSLRRAERFDHEIEIPVPDSKSRAAILKTLLGLAPNSPDDLLDGIAERTHGYVGSDLSELVQKAGHEAERQISQDVEKVSSINAKDAAAGSPDLKGIPTPQPTKADFEVALSKTAPTAMREIFLEAPNVRWTDIGGQESVKQALREGVIWQFKVSSAFLPRFKF